MPQLTTMTDLILENRLRDLSDYIHPGNGARLEKSNRFTKKRRSARSWKRFYRRRRIPRHSLFCPRSSARRRALTQTRLRTAGQFSHGAIGTLLLSLPIVSQTGSSGSWPKTAHAPPNRPADVSPSYQPDLCRGNYRHSNSSKAELVAGRTRRRNSGTHCPEHPRHRPRRAYIHTSRSAAQATQATQAAVPCCNARRLVEVQAWGSLSGALRTRYVL